MQILSIIRIVGLLVALFSSTMLPAMVAFGYRDGGGTEFVNSFVIALLLGLLLWFPNRHQKRNSGPRKASSSWCCSGWCWGAWCRPLHHQRRANMSVSEAFSNRFPA